MNTVKRIDTVTPHEPLSYGGPLHISGHLLEGCDVTASGDIVIPGSIYNSTVRSTQGSIVVKDKISGKQTWICSDQGDIRCRKVRNATLEAARDIYVADELIGTSVSSKGSLIMGQNQSPIIGGHIEVGAQLIAGTIGDGETPTLILVSDVQRQDAFCQLIAQQSHYAKLGSRIDECRDHLKFFDTLADRHFLPVPTQTRRSEFLKNYPILLGEFEQKRDLIHALEERLRNPNFLDQYIIVQDTLFPMVTIRFKKLEYKVTTQQNHVIIRANIDEIRVSKYVSQTN